MWVSSAFILSTLNDGKGLMVMSTRHTCHSKLNYTFNFLSPHFTFKFGIVSRVDVLDKQGSSSFNFNSSLIRWRNITMFLDTTTAPENNFLYVSFTRTLKMMPRVALSGSVQSHTSLASLPFLKQLGLEGSWVKRTSAPPKIDNHKHNIPSPFVTCVRIIFRKKSLNRVHHKGKCKQ